VTSGGGGLVPMVACHNRVTVQGRLWGVSSLAWLEEVGGGTTGVPPQTRVTDDAEGENGPRRPRSDRGRTIGTLPMESRTQDHTRQVTR
jgi:hypothetical protein